MRFRLTLLLALAALAAGPGRAADTYKPGDTFAAFTTKDQHDKPFTYDGGVRLVFVAFDMSTGKAANAFFEKQPADLLERQRALFLSHIHGMPGIARAFALPKMRKYPHRILLADGEQFLARYPAQDGKLTVLTLDDKGVVTAIRFADPKKDLPSLLAAP